jgi:chromosome segregation ATPase
MSCVAICHHGHALNTLAYGPLRCECGRHESCNDTVLRKAARLDDIAAVRKEAARADREWKEAGESEKRLQREISTLEQELEGQHQAIGEYEQVVSISLARETELRAKLREVAVEKAAGDLRELIDHIASEVRVRDRAAETAQRAEQERGTSSARLTQVRAEAQQLIVKVVSLQMERADLADRMAKLLNFEGL